MFFAMQQLLVQKPGYLSFLKSTLNDSIFFYGFASIYDWTVQSACQLISKYHQAVEERIHGVSGYLEYRWAKQLHRDEGATEPEILR